MYLCMFLHEDRDVTNKNSTLKERKEKAELNREEDSYLVNDSSYSNCKCKSSEIHARQVRENKETKQRGDNYLKSIDCEIQLRFLRQHDEKLFNCVYCIQICHLQKKAMESTHSRSHLSP